MSTLSQPPARHTRLRDFGAFQTDVSAVMTQKVEVCKPESPQETPRTGIMGLLPQRSAVSPVIPIDAAISRRSSAFQMKSDGTVTIIPFQPPLPAQDAEHTQVTNDQRASRTERRVVTKKRFNLMLRIAFTVALLAFLFHSLSWGALWGELQRVRHGLVLIGLAIGASGIVVSAYQWRSLLRSERIRFDLAELINIYIVGIAFSHFLPTGMGGDVLKASYTGRESGNSEGAMSAMIMSRVTGFLGMLVIAISVLIVWHAAFSFTIMLWFVLLSLLILGAIAFAILSTTLLARRLKRKSAKNRVFAFVVRAGNALSAMLKRPRSLMIASLYGMLFWIVACLNYYSYAEALGMQVPLYFYFVAIPLVALVTFLPVSINGFGIREGILVYAFATVHVPASTALLLALLVDAQTLFFGIIGGCVYLTLGDTRKGTRARADSMSVGSGR